MITRAATLLVWIGSQAPQLRVGRNRTQNRAPEPKIKVAGELPVKSRPGAAASRPCAVVSSVRASAAADHETNDPD
jgi:hypothetical protein